MKSKNTCGQIVQRHSLILFLLLIHLASLAQTITVKGIVKNEKGEALAGATLSVKGTAIRTVTDGEGRFSVQAPSPGTLTVSIIGYASYEEKLEGRADITIILHSKAAELNDVVVVGYGTQKRADLTGAVVAVTATKVSYSAYGDWAPTVPPAATRSSS